MSGLPERVEQQIETIVSAEGLELVHVEYRKQGRGWLLRIDIDKEGGVMLADCELVSGLESVTIPQAPVALSDGGLPPHDGALLDVASRHRDIPTSMIGPALTACSVESVELNWDSQLVGRTFAVS